MKHLLKVGGISLLFFVFVVLVGAEAVLEQERNAPGATITTMSDALWWAINVCSVGDANIGPVTTDGRVTGSILILIGYACFTVNVGIVTVALTRLLHMTDKYDL